MSRVANRPQSAQVTWQDVECGGYAGDLATWEHLAHEAAGPVLELGCGAGRVALHLARAGFQVTGLDRSPDLVVELRHRAAAAGIELDAVEADVCDFELGRRFALVLAPMQLVHLLGGSPRRATMLRCADRHLASGGVLAVALLTAETGATSTGEIPDEAPHPAPDVRELDGWVYSSLPLDTRASGKSIEVRRLRQVVSPAGELTEELDVTRLDPLDAGRLAAEAASVAGLRERERLEIAPTRDHVGSTVLVLEAQGSR
ncbi:MAG: class I SAM-dependent methyltransferase [Solirubrobacterales bacterium]